MYPGVFPLFPNILTRQVSNFKNPEALRRKPHMAIILYILSNQYWTLFPIMYSLHLSIHSKDQRIQ